MSLYERVQKDVLVGPPFTQGPRGWMGSSGSRESRTSEREGETKRQERRRERWAEMGRMAGRQTAEDFFFLFFLKNEKKKAQGLVEAVTLRSPTCQVQAANEEAERGRADEELEVSEKSASESPKTKRTKHPSSLFAQIHSARGRREKRMEKDESKSTGKGATDRGNKLGALVECEVSLWHLTQCTVHVHD